MKSCIIAGEGKLPILLAEKNKDFLVIVIRSLSVSSNFKNKTYRTWILLSPSRKVDQKRSPNNRFSLILT